MTRYSDHDEYVDPATGVLKNLLGISDPILLEIAEANFVSTRSTELSFSPMDGKFDLQHLQTIHWHLFRDVYAWAGSLRTVDISKGDNRFAHHAFIESASKPIFHQLSKERYLAGLDKEQFCHRIAYYLGEFNALHPFREGNGRTQREFINLIARRNGFIFVWKQVDRHNLLRASIQSFKGDFVELAGILRGIIQELIY